MEFKDSKLVITGTKITSDFSSVEVMMGWEAPAMQEHAKIVCHNKGDVLEIGFGLGISADYIQALGPKTHTIVEIHPQIYATLEIWAADKPNVIIYNEDWFDIKDTLEKFDGIFFDTFGDINSHYFAQTFAGAHINPGGKFTYYNDGQGFEHHIYAVDATYTTTEVSPKTNHYFNYDTYYVPTIIF